MIASMVAVAAAAACCGFLVGYCVGRCDGRRWIEMRERAGRNLRAFEVDWPVAVKRKPEMDIEP